MQYANEKERLYRIFVESALTGKEDMSQYTGVSKRIVDRWIKAFFAPVEAFDLPKIPRLVNRYTIGADPEFAFVHPIAGYTHAEGLGMNTLLPFGCDMAGRQAELRAAPSRFVLEVIASLTDALRWIPVFHPSAMQQSWLACPAVEKDGCGGHIHLARKRPDRIASIFCLDTATMLLRDSGVYDRTGMAQRTRLTKNGRPGDFRLQSHGFEYRTPPTWLHSPLGAYVSIVLSKLQVMFGNYKPIACDAPTTQRHILNTFRYYRNLDDDAKLALRAVEVQGWPIAAQNGIHKDFKHKWGVPEGVVPKAIEECFMPMSLAPEKSTVKELFEYLRIGTPLPKRIPIVQHEPFDLPAGFFPVKVTAHHFDVPNIAQGLVSRHYEVMIQTCAEGASLAFYFGAEFPDIGEAKKAVFKAVGVHARFRLHEGYKGRVLIEVPRNLAKNREQSRALREVLATPSLFPICKGFELKNADWSAWDQLSMKSTEPRKYKGQILHSVKGGAMKQEEIDF